MAKDDKVLVTKDDKVLVTKDDKVLVAKDEKVLVAKDDKVLVAKDEKSVARKRNLVPTNGRTHAARVTHTARSHATKWPPRAGVRTPF